MKRKTVSTSPQKKKCERHEGLHWDSFCQWLSSTGPWLFCLQGTKGKDHPLPCQKLFFDVFSLFVSFFFLLHLDGAFKGKGNTKLGSPQKQKNTKFHHGSRTGSFPSPPQPLPGKAAACRPAHPARAAGHSAPWASAR